MKPPTTYFFYDLETSGINPRESRVMQFAGQRTSQTLEPIGEPENILIKMTDDILPEPEAILLTGVTPQSTLYDGISEVEFLRYFNDHIAQPGTIFVGFNSIRFDDEFIRYMHYRNFYDAYEWQWQDGRSKWDLLDVVRMTRALRPDGINWPTDSKGAPTNRLELLTKLNGLEHDHAHDALSDVHATIAVARMIRNKQTRLFDYLVSIRSKQAVAELVESHQPFVYTSGAYSSQFEKTTVAQKITNHPVKAGVFVFDLRFDPEQYDDLSPEQLAELWKWKKDPTAPKLPVKTLQYNRCPAVAPLGVLDGASQKNLQLDLSIIQANSQKLASMNTFPTKILKAWEILEAGREQASLLSVEQDVDSALYNGFFNNQDKNAMAVVRAASPEELSDLNLPFNDTRLTALLPLYKARNFSKNLTDEEREWWESYRTQKLLNGGEHSRMAKYFARLHEISQRDGLSDAQIYLIEELKLYAQSIMPELAE